MEGAAVWGIIGIAGLIFFVLVLYAIFSVIDDRYMDVYRSKKKKGKK